MPDAAVAPDFERAFGQLCHLVALNKTNMVDGARDNLLATTLVLDDASGHRSAVSIGAAAFVLFGVRLDADDLDRSVHTLLEAGHVLRGSDGVLRASPDQRARVEGRVQAARILEATVRQEWFQAAADVIGDEGLHEPLWNCLKTYLALAFRRHGAETVYLLDPNAIVPEGTLTSYFDEAVARAGLAPHRPVAQSAIDIFFHQSTAARSSYLVQLLDGTFTFYALSLDEATISYLRESLSPLTIFLDTNYIFGLLDLHDNVFMRASKELVRFIRENNLPFHLYYHEYTFAEIDRTLSAQADRLRSRRWSSAISRAAIDTDSVYGLERLYHRVNAETPTDLDAFLSRYENVRELLIPLGLKIYREGAAPSFTLKEKSLLIAEYLDFLSKEAPRPKAYAAADHDASMWLALRRLRTPGQPVLDSGAIFLTNDYWFQRFDRTRAGLSFGGGPGAVVLPTQLLQLLRPLVPATDDFDRRFVDTFASPEFRTVQTGYSATSAKVLSYLATYKDLPTPTAVAILRNHALASRLRPLDEDSPAFREAIESEIVEINRSLLEERVSLAQERAAKTQEPAPYQSDESERLRRDLDHALTVLARWKSGARWLITLVAFVVGAAAIFFGPDLLAWKAVVEPPHSAGLRLASAIIWAGACWFLGIRRDRAGVVAIIVGGLYAITQIL